MPMRNEFGHAALLRLNVAMKEELWTERGKKSLIALLLPVSQKKYHNAFAWKFLHYSYDTYNAFGFFKKIWTYLP